MKEKIMVRLIVINCRDLINRKQLNDGQFPGSIDMYKWSVNNKILTVATKTRFDKLKMIASSVGIKIFVISEEIVKPFLGCAAEGKNTEQ
jgi:hypothetical protein